MTKYEKEIVEYKKVTAGKDGVEIILTERIDSWGEFCQPGIIDAMKTITTDTISEYRALDNVPSEPKNYWKDEFERRQAKPDFKVHMNEEGSSNYQRKILPWD